MLNSHKCKFPAIDGFNPKTVKCLHCEKLSIYIPPVNRNTDKL